MSLPCLTTGLTTVLDSRSRASKDLVGLLDSTSQRTARRQLHHKVKVAVECKVCVILDPPSSHSLHSSSQSARRQIRML